MTPDPLSLVPLDVWQVVGQSTVCLALGLLVSRRLADRPARAHCALLAELAVALLPWQPLAWVARRRLALYCEFAADDWALAAGRSAPDYAAALLALGGSPARPIQLGAGGFLKIRLRRILRARHALYPRLGRSWALAAVGVAVLLATGLALAQDRPGRPDSFLTQPHALAQRTPLP